MTTVRKVALCCALVLSLLDAVVVESTSHTGSLVRHENSPDSSTSLPKPASASTAEPSLASLAKTTATEGMPHSAKKAADIQRKKYMDQQAHKEVVRKRTKARVLLKEEQMQKTESHAIDHALKELHEMKKLNIKLPKHWQFASLADGNKPLDANTVEPELRDMKQKLKHEERHEEKTILKTVDDVAKGEDAENKEFHTNMALENAKTRAELEEDNMKSAWARAELQAQLIAREQARREQMAAAEQLWERYAAQYAAQREQAYEQAQAEAFARARQYAYLQRLRQMQEVAEEEAQRTGIPVQVMPDDDPDPSPQVRASPVTDDLIRQFQTIGGGDGGPDGEETEVEPGQSFPMKSEGPEVHEDSFTLTGPGGIPLHVHVEDIEDCCVAEPCSGKPMCPPKAVEDVREREMAAKALAAMLPVIESVEHASRPLKPAVITGVRSSRLKKLSGTIPSSQQQAPIAVATPVSQQKAAPPAAAPAPSLPQNAPKKKIMVPAKVEPGVPGGQPEFNS